MVNKKLSDQMVLDAFEHRARVGKLDLTAAEITDIINEHLIDGDSEDDTVSRQAVHYRLSQMVERDEPPVMVVNHGRTKAYHLTGDVKLFDFDRKELKQIKNNMKLHAPVTAGSTVTKSGRELEPEVGRKGPPKVQAFYHRLFSLLPGVKYDNHD